MFHTLEVRLENDGRENHDTKGRKKWWTKSSLHKFTINCICIQNNQKLMKLSE